MLRDDDIVRLVTAQHPAQAHLWREALEEEGIPAKVVGDYLEAGFGDMAGVQPEVWVHREDLQRARQFLNAHEHKEEVGVEEED
jgi:hypothetical protein